MKARLFAILWCAQLLVAFVAVRADATSKAKAQCEMQDYTPERITNINGMPSYFAKVTADGRYMCYINSGNFVLDLDNPSTSVRVPGPFDPVPAPPVGPDNRVQHIATPAGGMHFFNFSDVTGAMQPGKSVDLTGGGIQPVHVDGLNFQNYQSIGVLPGTHDKPVYRMLTGSLNVNDYDTRTTPWTETRMGTVCGNPGRYQLPMLSKDGQELSVYDTNEGVTKIMALRADGSCEEEINLGIATGKVEFSYDNNSIAFHVDSYSNLTAGREFSGVDSDVVKNIYVMQIDRRGGHPRISTLRRITANQTPGQGSYYPSFTQDGKVVYVHGERDKDNNVHYSFRTVDPHLTRAVVNPLASPHCMTCDNDRAASLALGLLWSNVCTKLGEQLTLTDASLWTLSLDPAACKKLVHDKWTELRSKVLRDVRLARTGVTPQTLNSLTEQAIAGACPTTAATRPAARTLSPADQITYVQQRETGAQAFQNHCLSCHSGGPVVFDWEHLTLDQINSMLISIDNGSMPREPVNDRENTLRPLIEVLRSRRQQLEAVEP